MKSTIFGAAIGCIVTIIGHTYPGTMPLMLGLVFGMMSMAMTGDDTVKDYIRQELEEAASELHANTGERKG